MGKPCLESLKSKWDTRNLSTNEKVMLLLWIILLLAIRIVLNMLLLAQATEFLLATVWILGLSPAILISLHLGLRASILLALLFWASGVAIEVAGLALSYNSERLFFRSLAILTLISSVTVIIGVVFFERLKSKQEVLNSLGRGLAVIEERCRIGRELHDTLAQILPTLKLKLFLAIGEIESQRPEKGLVILRELEDILQQEIVNTRCVIADFKYDISAEKSFFLTLHECLEKARRYYELDIEVRMPERVAIDFPLEIKAHLARIVQEALTNIWKHAKTKKAYFYLDYESEFISLIIEDHGCGFDMYTVSQSQYGVFTMRERAELINAKLEIYSRPNVGTSVTVNIPLRLGEVKNDGEEKNFDC